MVKPWFVAKDVAELLGYGNPQQAVRLHCKNATPVGVLNNSTLDKQTSIIPESDVYRLIIKSNKPEAEKFEAWVMEEVLPSIRKTGRYETNKMSKAEWLLQQAQAMVEQERRLSGMESKVKEIEARTNNSDSGYYSIMGYAVVLGRKVTLTEAANLGREASKICNGLSLPTGTVPDPRFGRIKTYPEEVLKEIFQ